MYLGSYRAGETLPIMANTHDPTSGAASDADAEPTFQVFTAGTVEILSGSLQQSGPDGFYVAGIDTSELEVGAYMIRISATVSGTTGALLHAFDVHNVPADVWRHPGRTLTIPSGQIFRPQDQSRINIHAGDTIAQEITDLGNLVSYDQIDFTVKAERADTDDNAIIRIRYGQPAGLLRLNRAATTETGSIEIDNAFSGSVTIHLDHNASRKLAAARSLHYDIQGISIDGVFTLCEGYLDVIDDITKAVV